MATDTLTTSEADLDRLAVDTVRVLAMDAIQKASSGHPGTAMASAPAAYVLWTRFLRFDPAARLRGETWPEPAPHHPGGRATPTRAGDSSQPAAPVLLGHHAPLRRDE